MSLHEGASAVPSAPVIEALARLALRQKRTERHRQPVAIIGPGDGGARECDAARTIAHHLASAGMAVVCGGRGGVMAAAARGATEAGGIAIGILPEEDDRNANQWLSVAVPTGMGELRNAIVARSGVCLIAVGGNMGTLSEMAMGLKWGKPVFVIFGDVSLPGAVEISDVDDMLFKVANTLLCMP